ncbi:hypothetical protein [Xanthocytophaga agilis]|uniref:General secretion pathway protein n=1 Tax=Xanthocytophaga agilis TaxID=3048010 RepID=A0AAE3R004_9BACT|nr:hypothetical protein [Xanthocytophaga agilis]MDJ1501251.1 hypothetical protein [Xanthocytophaga agilis]
MFENLLNWKSFSYQKRYRLLWFVVVIFLWIAYTIAISPTIEAYQHYQDLARKAAQGSSAPDQLARLHQEMQRANAYMVSEGADSNRTDPLLAGLTPLCRKYGVRIDALLPAKEEQKNNHIIVTRSVRLQGDYLSLVQIVHRLEYELETGRLASVQFSVQEDIFHQKRTLYAECFLQQMYERKKSVSEETH